MHSSPHESGGHSASEVYHEKLWPSLWMFLATALVIPASLVVLAPLSFVAGIVTACALYGGCVIALVLASPTIDIRDGELKAGKATIGLSQIGEARAYSSSNARDERGINMDARAWLLIRGWIGPVVRLPIVDQADPTPYWLISSRRPHEMAAVINRLRASL